MEYRKGRKVGQREKWKGAGMEGTGEGRNCRSNRGKNKGIEGRRNIKEGRREGSNEVNKLHYRKRRQESIKKNRKKNKKEEG